MIKTQQRIASIAVTCAIACGIGVAASAGVDGADVALSIRDRVFALEADPGADRTIQMAVHNGARRAVEVEMDVVPYRIGDDNAITVTDEEGLSHVLRQWIAPQAERVTIAPNATATLTVTVRVPANAAPGSYHGLLVVRNVVTMPETPDTATVGVRGQVGAHVLLNVRGHVTAGGKVERFTASPVFASDTVTYAMDFRNTGGAHYVPAARMDIRNVMGVFRATYDLNSADRFAFPQTRLALTTAQPIPSRWGLYYVKATVVDGDGVAHERRAVVVGTFFPLALFAGGGGVVVLLWWVRRRRRGA